MEQSIRKMKKKKYLIELTDREKGALIKLHTNNLTNSCIRKYGDAVFASIITQVVEFKNKPFDLSAHPEYESQQHQYYSLRQ